MTGVAVIGAGPTGSALAAQLHAHGADVRLVERRTGPAESRAFLTHSRTLEALAPLGIADELVARGDPSARGQVHAGGRSASASIAPSGITDTAYPFLLAIPQAYVEEVLADHLDHAGVPVERGTELVSLSQRDDVVRYDLRHPDGHIEHAEAAYLVGCDGAGSTVRAEAGIAFPSRPYRATLLLADLEVDGVPEHGAFHGFVGEPGILFLFPSPGVSTWRLLAVAPARRSGCEPPDLTTLQHITDRFTDGRLRLHGLTWSSTVRLRRGQAERYRAGRVLLAGDAAHVHSPAGGQGMNTGIQDACNLGWKLALVAEGRAPDALLDSYEVERRPVASRTRRLTDLAFYGEAADLAPLRWLRRYVAPWVVPLLNGRTAPAPAFRLLGGLSFGYRDSPAVEEGQPSPDRGPRAGDRFGDGRVVANGRTCWLHDVLRPPGLHLVLCGRPECFDTMELPALLDGSRVPLAAHRLTRRSDRHVLIDPDGRLLGRLTDGRPAVYLVRPDGYVAYRSAGTGLAGVARYLSAHGLAMLRGDPVVKRAPGRAAPGGL